MELYVGGYKQGKLNYVLTNKKDADINVINDLHLLIKKNMKEGIDPRSEINKILEADPDCIFICDEVGNGIVPADAFERKYRDEVGSILIELARKAERVERIICGIGQRIK